MALVIGASNSQWRSTARSTSTHELTVSDTTSQYTAPKTATGSGDRVVSNGQYTYQDIESIPRVTCRRNKENQIIVTRIDATSPMFVYNSNGQDIGARTYSYAAGYKYNFRTNVGGSWRWQQVYQYINRYYESPYYGQVLASYNSSVNSVTVFTGTHVVEPGETWTVDYHMTYNHDGTHPTVGTITIQNTYAAPTPTPPTIESCDFSVIPSSYRGGRVIVNVSDWGYCKDEVQSFGYQFINPDGSVLAEGTSGDEKISYISFQPNTTYTYTVTANNGCAEAECEGEGTTLAGNETIILRASSSTSAYWKLGIIAGNQAYPVSTALKYRMCESDEWTQLAVTDELYEYETTIKDLQPNTCYEACATTTTEVGSYTSPIQQFRTFADCGGGYFGGVLSTSFSNNRLRTNYWVTYDNYTSSEATFSVYKRLLTESEWTVVHTQTVAARKAGTLSLSTYDFEAGLNAYEIYVKLEAENCIFESVPVTYITPLAPNSADPQVCDTLQYLTELICQATKAIYEGNKEIYANPASVDLCAPNNEDPTLLTFWSRILRYMHALACLTCEFGYYDYRGGMDGQYYHALQGWVKLLTEVVTNEDKEAWKLITSDAAYDEIQRLIKSVWHYQGTAEYLVGKKSELPSSGVSSGDLAIVAEENKVYKRGSSSWSVDSSITPKNFGIWHIVNESETSFGNVKAHSAYYYWEGTWNNLDAGVTELDGWVQDLSADIYDHQFFWLDEAIWCVLIDHINFDASSLPEGRKTVAFLTEDTDYYQDNYYTISFNSNGGLPMQSQRVSRGAAGQEAGAPIYENHTFSYWALNGSRYNWSTILTGNITLTAVWSN